MLPEKGPENAGMSVGEVLLRALEHRQRCGARLVDLELDHCSETAQWLREAEDLVERVLVSESGRDKHDKESNHGNDEDVDNGDGDSEQHSSENENVDGSEVEASSEDDRI
ncbi:hypothetical protein FA95DRAFT_1607771 [Auriscalpium vulgare]|uniref:Uncharacterized protein n=1 Tax=Auriscalpium vulgare TaxID=40419 RepID=A0ACB8RMA7_9AGAM|nr:hypothetical protein FA95DRAFT_1607771 [Auriscalpium vulgare]